MPRPLDEIDRALLTLLASDPRIAHSELARRAGVARGTVYTRLERMEREGLIRGYGPEIDPSVAGLDVLAFCTLEITQGSLEETTRALAAVAEVLEVHTVTGPGDLLCRIVARSNDHLHEVLQQIAAIPAVTQSQTHLALATNLQRSPLGLLIDG